MARAFRVPWRRQLHSILLPAVEPFLLAGCAAALGMSWKAGVAAEVIGVVTGSLGERLYDVEDLPPDRRPAGLDRSDRGAERPV